ncbi:hypothetical protein [Ferruginivarius sediminum]|uniref:Uncharacterized protein n=1 Tax=Ferruginivarius sediminum TaxID=2661937 RepID=A0A369TEX3_9PROT|nr:hypothetical protein [Ferruginivarius sediminum]RDD62667.1 hypothetical protein DRB17_05760 [Ferruginivarius sediminum]
MPGNVAARAQDTPCPTDGAPFENAADALRELARFVGEAKIDEIKIDHRGGSKHCVTVNTCEATQAVFDFADRASAVEFYHRAWGRFGPLT